MDKCIKSLKNIGSYSLVIPPFGMLSLWVSLGSLCGMRSPNDKENETLKIMWGHFFSPLGLTQEIGRVGNDAGFSAPPEATRGLKHIINPPESMIYAYRRYSCVCSNISWYSQVRACVWGMGYLRLWKSWCCSDACGTTLTHKLTAEPSSWALLPVSRHFLSFFLFFLLLSLFSFTPNPHFPLCVNITLFWTRQPSLTSPIPYCHFFFCHTNDCLHKPVVLHFPALVEQGELCFTLIVPATFLGNVRLNACSSN